MSSTSETLFRRYATGEDALSRLFQPNQMEDNIFSSIDVRSMTKEFASFPGNGSAHENLQESTLFSTISDDAEPSSSSVTSVLSLEDEITQNTIPEEDVWQAADSLPSTSKKLETWESFGSNRTHCLEPVNPFVTEQNPQVFDELLKRHMHDNYSSNESGVVVGEVLFREVDAFLVIEADCSLFWPLQ